VHGKRTVVSIVLPLDDQLSFRVHLPRGEVSILRLLNSCVGLCAKYTASGGMDWREKAPSFEIVRYITRPLPLSVTAKKFANQRLRIKGHNYCLPKCLFDLYKKSFLSRSLYACL
jgi:hypothetical protein